MLTATTSRTVCRCVLGATMNAVHRVSFPRLAIPGKIAIETAGSHQDGLRQTEPTNGPVRESRSGQTKGPRQQHSWTVKTVPTPRISSLLKFASGKLWSRLRGGAPPLEFSDRNDEPLSVSAIDTGGPPKAGRSLTPLSDAATRRPVCVDNDLDYCGAGYPLLSEFDRGCRVAWDRRRGIGRRCHRRLLDDDASERLLLREFDFLGGSALDRPARCSTGGDTAVPRGSRLPFRGRFNLPSPRNRKEHRPPCRGRQRRVDGTVRNPPAPLGAASPSSVSHPRDSRTGTSPLVLCPISRSEIAEASLQAGHRRLPHRPPRPSSGMLLKRV